MKTTKFFIITAVCIPFILNSCENMIETDFPTHQINVSDVFGSVSTADGALSNLYADLQYYSIISGGKNGMGSLLGSYTDDLNCYLVSSVNGALDLFHNQQLSTNQTVKTLWNNAYKEIYSANLIIEGVEKSTNISYTDKQRIKGEALFVRSMLYFYLSQIFGSLPYVTTTDYVVNQSINKISENEVLTLVQNDLENAKTLLKDDYRNADRVYPNRKAAQLMLALVLMQQKRWNEAEQNLRSISESPIYKWESDIVKTFQKSGKHIIWQLKPLKANDATEEALTYYFATSAPISYGLSENLVQAFLPNDKRKQNWTKAFTINQNAYFRNDKYKKISANTDEYSVVFRLEEVYLLLAETLCQQNKTEEALTYINAVRQKAGIYALANATQEELLNEIVEENRREFFTERGIRFITLKRNNMLGILTSVKPNWKNYHQNWPIPLSELLLNPSLNPQNTGY